jgi:hypothetical protein
MTSGSMEARGRTCETSLADVSNSNFLRGHKSGVYVITRMLVRYPRPILSCSHQRLACDVSQSLLGWSANSRGTGFATTGIY